MLVDDFVVSVTDCIFSNSVIWQNWLNSSVTCLRKIINFERIGHIDDKF